MYRTACAIILLLSVLFVVGCGGGGGKSPSIQDPGTTGVSVNITPAAISLKTGEQCTFSAAASGATNTAVTWSIDEELDGGLITSSGHYTAPSTENPSLHVRATSVADPTKSAVAIVEVKGEGVTPGGNNGVEISISPNQVFLPPNVRMQFSSTVVGHSNTGVDWSILEQDGGVITTDGWYTAPNHDATVHVRVTSKADPSKSATATVIVIPGLPPIPFPS